MPITRLDHVQLAMPPGREADARAFYDGVLGIPEVTKPENLRARGGCWFEQGGVKVHLGVESDFRPARKAHPAFLVENLPAFKQAITSAGFAVTTDEALDGYDRVYVSDPFGNRIELLEQNATNRAR
jgi:catechol 2,3-dioxygenase-like lactoylglutathione lyase family enzyme